MPWLSRSCTRAFLDAAEPDLPVAMLTYLPSDNAASANSSTYTPLPNDPAWALDGGSWKKDYNFPVYAVPDTIGASWMHQVAAYNGNVTDVPNGDDLRDMGLVEPTDYVRLMADISLGTTDCLESPVFFFELLF